MNLYKGRHIGRKKTIQLHFTKSQRAIVYTQKGKSFQPALKGRKQQHRASPCVQKMGIKALKGRKQNQIKRNAFALSGLIPSFWVTQGGALCYCFRPFRAEKNCTFVCKRQSRGTAYFTLDYFGASVLITKNQCKIIFKKI